MLWHREGRPCSGTVPAALKIRNEHILNAFAKALAPQAGRCGPTGENGHTTPSGSSRGLDTLNRRSGGAHAGGTNTHKI